MKRDRIALVGLMVSIVMLISGCGKSSRTSMDSKESGKPAINQSKADGAKAGGKTNKAESSELKTSESKTSEVATSIAGGTESTVQSVTNAILSKRKIIRNANLSVEVENFDKAYGQIKSIIGASGFVQETNIKKDKVYVDKELVLVPKGIIIIRVDKDKFDQVLSDVKGLGLLVDESIKSDDVTDKFFDTEARLRVLKFEESRIEEYLKKLTDPDTIFKTESRLTDIRHEIESLTGTIQKLSDLVDLSTITINMNEKSPVGTKVAEAPGYWSRLGSGFIGSTKGVVRFVGELAIFLAEALPGLVLLAIFGFVGFKIYRKSRKNKMQTKGVKKEKEDDVQG